MEEALHIIRGENKLLTINEVADWLGIKIGTLYTWVHYKKIPFVKIGGKLRFEMCKIEEFIRNNSHN